VEGEVFCVEVNKMANEKNFKLKDLELVLICRTCSNRYIPRLETVPDYCSHHINPEEREQVRTAMLGLEVREKIGALWNAMQNAGALNRSPKFPFQVLLELKAGKKIETSAEPAGEV
jgi:hypothetical protein